MSLQKRSYSKLLNTFEAIRGSNTVNGVISATSSWNDLIIFNHRAGYCNWSFKLNCGHSTISLWNKALERQRNNSYIIDKIILQLSQVYPKSNFSMALAAILTWNTDEILMESPSEM